MSYEDWVEQYQPETTEHDDLVQYAVWTDIPETVPVERRWAVVDPGEPEDDAEDPEPGPWAILPGYHLVNVVYFTVTANPWKDIDSPTHVVWD